MYVNRKGRAGNIRLWFRFFWNLVRQCIEIDINVCVCVRVCLYISSAISNLDFVIFMSRYDGNADDDDDDDDDNDDINTHTHTSMSTLYSLQFDFGIGFFCV